MALPLPRAFWPVTIVAGVNDKIDFRVSPTTYAATVAPGTYYSPRELLDAVIAACVTALGSGNAWYATAWPVDANLLTAPEDLTNAAWAKSNATITANTHGDPHGDVTIDTITDNAVNIQHYVNQNLVDYAAGDPVTVQAVVGAGTLSRVGILIGDLGVLFNLTSVTTPIVNGGVTASIRSLGAGWYQIIASALLRAGDPVRVAFALSNTDATIVPLYVGGTGTVKVGWASVHRSLSFGGYQPQALAAQLPGHVTLMRGAATLELLFGTGANKTTSVHRVLGFADADRAAAIVHTSDYQHQNGWYAEDPVIDDTRDLPLYERAQSVALGGQSYSLDFATRYQRIIRLGFLPAYKAWKADEGSLHVNEALERMFDVGWQRLRWWPDAGVEGTYEDLVMDLETAKAMAHERLSPGNPLYSQKMKFWKFVAP